MAEVETPKTDTKTPDQKTANGAPAKPLTPEEQAKAAKAKNAEELHAFAKRDRDREARLAKERSDRAATEARAEQAEKRAADLERRLKEIEETDPLDYVEKRGVDARKLAERIVKSGTPDERISKAEERAKAAEEAAAKIEKDLADRERQAALRQAQANAKQKMLDAFEGLKASHPRLSKLSEAKLIDEYLVTYRAAKADPETAPYADQYSDEEILKATEQRLQVEAMERAGMLNDDELEELLTKRRAGAKTSGEPDKTAGASVRQGSEDAKVGRSAKALTNAAASESSGGWKPENWDRLTDREQNAIIVARWKSGLPLD